MNKLNKDLRDKAVLYGLCTGWQNDWKGGKTQQQLIYIYKKGIDFCFDNQYSSIELIKENFQKDLLVSNNIFVDDEISKKNPEGSCVFICDSTGSLIFDRFSTSDIYVNDDANLTISAGGFSACPLIFPGVRKRT